MSISENSTATGQDLLSRLTATPDIYVQKIDLVRAAALLVEQREDEYRAASFLDDRMLSPQMTRKWVGLKTLVERAEGMTAAGPVHFIFHTGHVGSTLVSRLIEAVDGVFSLREPYPLWQLAEAHDLVASTESFLSPKEFDKILDTFMRLWGRGFDGTHTIVVKATSSAGRLAPQILSRYPSSRALCLNVSAETYIASLLLNPASLIDLRVYGQERLRRLRGLGVQLSVPLYAMSPGQLAGLAWLVESWSQHQAMANALERTIAIDFDFLLGHLRDAMRQVLQNFVLPHDEQTLSALERSPSLLRYSKAPQHEYSPKIRTQNLAASRARNGEEISKGLALIERIASKSAGAAAVFGRSQAVA
jgi:hypothetical protein